MPVHSSSDEWRELIARAGDGDDRARTVFVERMRPRVLARIRMLMGASSRRHADSTDYLQNVLLQALERLRSAKFPDEVQALRWMTTVARNDLRDAIGKRREQAFDSLSGSCQASSNVVASDASPVSEADRSDRWARLLEAMDDLSEGERASVELHDLEGLTFAEVGARLNWSDDRARLTYVRAIARLGRLLTR